ncbi:hypothetical protein ACKI10_17180 [Streptomyces galilaeus]|uniref:Uncharacterized protein n=1 Tax=Streptomyces galilaeus TaxID=33899 RepID=A0ABW9IRN4_STRGJ
MKICCRCQEPIRPGEGYDTVVPDSMSAARPADYQHKGPCRPQPRQTAPVPR